jgi:hypothetical protein
MLSDRSDKVSIMEPRLDSSSITRHLSFDISFQELPTFLDYWSSKYNDPNKRDETFYDPHIGKADLRTDEGAILDLFTWKNGMVLSERKKESVLENYFRTWTEDGDLVSRYLNPKDENRGGRTWNIFYLHCRAPTHYPIFDQHARRAMIYIQSKIIWEPPINESRGDFYTTYLDDYMPFVAKCGGEIRTVDRALYTFGRFLKLVQPYTDIQPQLS